MNRKNMKLTSSGTSPAQIDKITKVPLASPRGRGEAVRNKHIVEQTMSNDLPVFDCGLITASLRSALS